jgi:hypothetical protein
MAAHNRLHQTTVLGKMLLARGAFLITKNLIKYPRSLGRPNVGVGPEALKPGILPVISSNVSEDGKYCYFG